VNEEDLRSKILVPWFDSLGLDRNEYDLEVGFQVRIGRDKVKRPRSDAVVRRGGVPVLVVEAKEPDHKISTADREQAISYARLLQPSMPPFAVVTNGTESDVLDVFSGKPVTWSIDDATLDPLLWHSAKPDPSVADLNLRFRALQLLVSLSPANLRVFCESQVREATERAYLEGSRPAFAPDAWVARAAIESKIDSFLSSDDVSLILLAPSGLGKTSQLIQWATRLTASEIPVYVPLDLAGGEPLRFIAEEFNWEFSSSRTEQQLLRDIISTAKACGRRVVLFLDEAEACPAEVLHAALERLHSFARQAGGHLRIVLAAQPATFDSLKTHRGMPSVFATKGSRNLFLPPLNVSEATSLLEILRSKYGFTGSPSAEVLQRCADPMFAQLLARGYTNSEVPRKVLPAHVFAELVRGRADRTGVPEDCLVAVRALASATSESGDEEVPIETVQGTSPETSRSQILRAARACLIEVRQDSHFRESLRFSDPWIQNYAVSYLALALDQTEPDARPSLLRATASNRVNRRATDWFLWANPSERASYLSEIEWSAREYLAGCNGVLSLFPCVSRGDTPLGLGFVPAGNWAAPWHLLLPNPGDIHRVQWMLGSYSEDVRDALDRLADSSADGRLRQRSFQDPSGEMMRATGAEDAFEVVTERLSRGPISAGLSLALSQDVLAGIAQRFPGWLGLATGKELRELTVADLSRRVLVVETFLSLYEGAWAKGVEVDQPALWTESEVLVDSGNERSSAFRFVGHAFPFDAFRDAISKLSENSSREIAPPWDPDLAVRIDANRVGPTAANDAAQLEQLLASALSTYREALGRCFRGAWPFIERCRANEPVHLRLELGPWHSYGGQSVRAVWSRGHGPEDTVEVYPRSASGWWPDDRLGGVFDIDAAGPGFRWFKQCSLRDFLGVRDRPPSLDANTRSGQAEKAALLWSTVTTWLREDASAARTKILDASPWRSAREPPSRS